MLLLSKKPFMQMESEKEGPWVEMCWWSLGGWAPSV